MNLKKKKFKLGASQQTVLEKKFTVYPTTHIRQKLKCAIPVITNKIKLYTFDGIITRTHKKGFNLNQTYTFVVTIAKSVAQITVPAQSPLLKIYPLD